jgi:hypothetical protein
MKGDPFSSLDITPVDQIGTRPTPDEAITKDTTERHVQGCKGVPK